MPAIIIPRRHYTQPRERVQIAPEWDTAVTAWSGHAPTDNAGRGGLFIPQSAALVSSVSRSGLGVRSTAYSSKGWLQGRIGNPATENWPGVTLALDVVMSADAGDYPALLSFMPVGELYGAWSLAAENTSGNRYFLIRIGDRSVGTGLSGGSWGSGFPANEWAPGDHFRIVISHDRAGSINFFWEKNGVHGSRSRNDAANSWRSGTSVENIGGYERSGFRSSPHTISFAAVLPHPIAEERARSLLNNPWQLFRADPIRIYSLPTGAITLNSITASNITSSGARITLEVTR